MSANDQTQMTALAQASAAAHPVPDRGHVNYYTSDSELQSLLALYLPADLHAHLQPYFERMGELAGGAVDDWALEADRNPPTLEMRSRAGKEQQRIVKHPAYVEMEKIAFQQFGLAAISHREDMLGWKGKMPPIVKYALTYLFVQSEFGLCCPLSMTDSLTRTLKKYGAPELVNKYLPKLLAMDFDSGVQGSMFMTEQAAGSDIANTLTMAYPQEDGTWRLYGEKWFCSNPDAGFGMVLARVDGGPPGMKGISLFLLPRIKDDGSTNHYHIVRLKDKMGTRSMASGEI
ncbi:MAG TPA: acyl-CoA dehydrogenase family protein, partial [Alicycliphilus denitrificans]|nr:acyl-CoA dehydrogenase family protein [Alicycliphilus denitrificans]